jgi:uncharacterized protein YdcH (DUF465 family)
LRKGDLIAITCTHAADQKMLSTLFTSKMGLHDIYTRSSPKPLSEYRAPVAPAELHSMGFEGYIIDYIEGPDTVLAMLCDNTRLNKIAYAPKPISDEQHEAVSSSPIQKWVSGRDISQITTRREYGVSSTSVTQLKPARSFFDQPANSEEKRQLDDTIKRIQRDVTEVQEELKKSKAEIVELKDQIQELRQAREEIQIEQDRMKKAMAEWRALPDKIKRKQYDLEQLIQDHAETSSRIRAFKAESQQASLSVAALTIDYAVSVHSAAVAICMLTLSRKP